MQQLDSYFTVRGVENRGTPRTSEVASAQRGWFRIRLCRTVKEKKEDFERRRLKKNLSREGGFKDLIPLKPGGGFVSHSCSFFMTYFPGSKSVSASFANSESPVEKQRVKL